MPTPPDEKDPLQRLLTVMALLRDEGGCPWDREQTHHSLTPYLIEEAYEVVDAIETGRPDALREELGDVLLQVVFHAQIASERGDYDFEDITRGLAEKLIRRHPHVFGGKALETAEHVRESWEAQKLAARKSVMEGIPAGLPALQWAGKVGGRAAAAGFDWKATSDIIAKIREEVEEFAEELAALGDSTAGKGGTGPVEAPAGKGAGDADRAAADSPADGGNGDSNSNRHALETEFGDLLFALVQLSRWQRIDAETALRRATRKFIARFEWMEREMQGQGQNPGSLGDSEWERLWALAKRHAQPQR